MSAVQDGQTAEEKQEGIERSRKVGFVMTEWENVGFDRDEKGRVLLIWECQKCGCEVYGGMEPPVFDCPKCGKEKGEKE